MKSIFAALMAGLALTAGIACAEGGGKPPSEAAAEEPEVLPRLSEIMERQQMRHIKLWFAGDGGDWTLADYELDQLGDGFDDVGKLLGGDLAQQHVGEALSQLKKAIDAKNRETFVAAFDSLSAGCNGCHRALDHAFIVIQRPALLPYSDQNFSPQP